MIISHKYRFIYFAPRKTGTTSMEYVLKKHFAAETMSRSKPQVQPRHDMMCPRNFVQYVSFTTVRNPYSRFLSQFNFYGPKVQQSIEVFVHGGWSPMLKELEGVRLDYVVRLESLQEDFRKLPFVNRHYDFPRWTVSDKIRVSYGPTIQKLVRERCQRDFEVFGYDPNDLSMISPKLL